MRKPKLREIGEALKVLFVEGPYTDAFPKELTDPPEEFRGKPVFDTNVCIGCGACSQVCPSNSIDIIDDEVAGTRTLKLHLDSCNFCGLCHIACTTDDGIDYSEEYELAGFDRSEMVEVVEKELALCEICGDGIGAKDHLTWLAERLGSLAYANPTLVLSDMERLSQLSGITGRDTAQKDDRSDLFRVLCPSCRRRIYLTEEW
jgi:hydrogenase-4 component H